MKQLTCTIALLLASATAQAQWSDDFNRPDGPIGADWTMVSGQWSVLSQQGAHTSSGVNDVLQHNAANSAYDSAVCMLDVFAPGSSSQFSGVFIGLGGADTIMVKIQDQVSTTAGFSNIGIYHLTSGSYGAWTGNGTGFATLTSPFVSARLKVYFSNSDTIVVELDTDFDGVPDQTYTKDGVLTFATSLGTGFGVAAWGATAVFDNWSTSTATPPVVSYCTAGTSTNGCTPAITASNQPSVAMSAPCVVSVLGVEGQKQGLIFYGVDNTGFAPLPWGSGSTSFFCVKSPVQRAVALNSGGTLGACDGTLTMDWNAYQAATVGALGAPFAVGAKAYVQAWYRDPPAPRTTNLSDAVELTYGP